MSNLVIIIMTVIAFVGFSALLVYLIRDTVKYNKRESLRTLKLNKLKYYNESRDPQLLKEIDELDRQMEEI